MAPCVFLDIFFRIEGVFKKKKIQSGFEKLTANDVMNLAVNWGRREEEEQEAKESGLPESVC